MIYIASYDVEAFTPHPHTPTKKKKKKRFSRSTFILTFNFSTRTLTQMSVCNKHALFVDSERYSWNFIAPLNLVIRFSPVFNGMNFASLHFPYTPQYPRKRIHRFGRAFSSAELAAPFCSLNTALCYGVDSLHVSRQPEKLEIADGLITLDGSSIKGLIKE